MNTQRNVLAVLGVFLVLLALAYMVRPITPSIDDVWVINLDKDKERLAQFLQDAHVLNQTVQRWPATYGKDVERTDAEAEGIHPSLTGPDNMKDRHQTTKIIRRPGEYGCWLSHKRLLQHLASLPVSAHHGHLILEDDCEIPSDFPLHWNQVRQEVPSDWDIVFLGIHNVHAVRVSDHVLRYQHGRQGGGNWGTHGYLVRHGAISDILQGLEYYHAPIDVQYYRTLHHKKVYIVDPLLVKQREGVISNIAL